MPKHIDKVKELEKKHQLLSENLVDSVWTVDVDTLTFDYITDSIEPISGFRAEEYIGRPLEKTLTPESFERIKAELKKHIPLFGRGIRQTTAAELEMVHKNGHHYWVEVRARLFQEPGEKLKIIGVTRDISARKKEEQQKNDLIEKLGKALAEKEKLIEENKILKSLLPICSGCRRIRDEKGRWLPLDFYLEKATHSKFTHTTCKDCQEAYYGDQEWYQKKK